MKIGIITSGKENLVLFKFLNKFEHEYFVYYDQNNWPYGDKNFEYSKEKIIAGINYLRGKGVEKIIVGPTYELEFLKDGKYKDFILPLFTQYLQNYCFTNSLVGKIGLAGDFADTQVGQKLISELSGSYTLNDNQKNIKKFHFPFCFWVKEVPMWKYYLTTLSYSHFMANKSVKFDLRYFKDSNVDTIIPLNYEFFNYQRVILKYFNFKKQKFHKLENIEKIFGNLNLQLSPKYTVNIYTNGHTEFLTRDKKLIWFLQKGKTCEAMFEKIN